MKTAVGFEAESMPDGSLRLRFLDGEDGILCQQMIDVDALVALQLLAGILMAKAKHVSPELLLETIQKSGIACDRALVNCLLNSARVRAILTPEGKIHLEAVMAE